MIFNQFTHRCSPVGWDAEVPQRRQSSPKTPKETREEMQSPVLSIVYKTQRDEYSSTSVAKCMKHMWKLWNGTLRLYLATTSEEGSTTGLIHSYISSIEADCFSTPYFSSISPTVSSNVLRNYRSVCSKRSAASFSFRRTSSKRCVFSPCSKRKMKMVKKSVPMSHHVWRSVLVYGTFWTIRRRPGFYHSTFFIIESFFCIFHNSCIIRWASCWIKSGGFLNWFPTPRYGLKFWIISLPID